MIQYSTPRFHIISTHCARWDGNWVTNLSENVVDGGATEFSQFAISDDGPSEFLSRPFRVVKRIFPHRRIGVFLLRTVGHATSGKRGRMKKKDLLLAMMI